MINLLEASLVLNWLLLPGGYKIISLGGIIVAGVEIWRKEQLIYSFWILRALWYGSQIIVFLTEGRRGIFCQIPFLFYYICWRVVVKIFEERWIQKWCAQKEHEFAGVHRGGIPFIGFWIGKVIPIWPWGRTSYFLSSETKEITPGKYNEDDEIRLIRGIDGAGKKGDALGVGTVRLLLEKGKCGETEKSIDRIPRPKWVKAYVKKYYVNTPKSEEKADSTSSSKNRKDKYIHIDNVNVYVDNRRP